MSTLVVRARYLEYIAILNERRFDDLTEHVEPRLTYNGESLTREEYQDLLRGDVRAIPDLFFDVHDLVVEEQRIAARIVFRCTPEREFLGLAPTGRRIEFAEHVFYRLREGRIAEVRSLIDRDRVREQLT
jgi:predicted ester cyclase